MIYEVCELLATHLRDGADGIDALVGSAPLAPEDPPLEAVTVVSEFEVPYLAGGKIPASAYKAGPLVLVRRADDVGEFAPPGNPDVMADDSRCGVAVLVLYPRETNHAVHVENRRLSALLRVVRRSVGHWIEQKNYESRELRGVQVVGLLGAIRVVPTLMMIGGEDATDLSLGAVLLDLNTTDRWAEGITPLT